MSRTPRIGDGSRIHPQEALSTASSARTRRAIARTDEPNDALEAALAAIDGEVKVEVASPHFGADAPTACARFEVVGGVVRRSLEVS